MFKIKQFLLVVLLSLCYTVSHAYDFMVDGIAYNINSDNQTVSVTNTEGSSNPTTNNYAGITVLSIPSTVIYSNKTYTVTSIGQVAFASSGLINVTIPNSVTTIGWSAFVQCKNLTSVSVGNNVTTIEQYAFAGCEKLKTLTLPNSVTSIGPEAFEYSGLTQFVIPASVSEIGKYAFYKCSELTSVTIGKSITQINGVSIFGDCQKLSHINVDPENPVLDSREDCNAIIETLTNTLIYGCKETIIPNSVTAIGCEAFCFCDGLTSIFIPNSVTEIGIGAFGVCTGLKQITIPSSVASIWQGAFIRCSNLKDVYLHRQTPPALSCIEEDADAEGSMFLQIASDATLHVKKDCGNAYNQSPWTWWFKNIVEDIPGDVLVESVVLNKSEVEISKGKSEVLAATLLPEDATNKSLEWTSSDTSVATVENGVITGVAPGKATITVKTTDGSNLTATCDVRVIVKGDVNGDGVVDILDINEIVNIILDD